MPCEPGHWYDADPCPNCFSTRTEGCGGDDRPTLVECLTCGEVFDVVSEEYQAFKEEE
jgi:hypothetical protein